MDEVGNVTKTNYLMSHMEGDDDLNDARILADKWSRVRAERDARISKTDYMALSDQTLPDDWKAYRQSLRDVPAQSDPDNISWPSEP